MENLSLYEKGEHFDPYTVMLFKALQVVAFLFFLALLAMNPQQSSGSVDTKAEFLITMTWPDLHPDDVDLSVEDPFGKLVWYRQRDVGLMHLERDDQGNYKDTIVVKGAKLTAKDGIVIKGETIVNPLNQEIVTIRGFLPGEYTVNVSLYRAITNQPVPVTVRIEKINPRVETVHYSTVVLSRRAEEITVARFTMNASGEVSKMTNEQKVLLGPSAPK